MKAKKIILKIGYPLLALAAFLTVWIVAAAIVGIDIILPSPLETAKAFFALFSDLPFWNSFGMSVLRTLESFAISFAAAIVLAALAKFWEPLARFLSPIVTVLRSVPTISVIFVAMVFINSAAVPILISFLIVFPLLYNGFLDGLRGVDKGLSEMSRLYRVPFGVQIRKFYIPAILPEVFSASRGAIGFNLKIVVAAEAIASTKLSLGKLMQGAQILLDGARLLAYTVAAILVSFLLEAIIVLIGKLVMKWRRQ